MIDRGSRDDFERIRLRGADLVWPEDSQTGGGVPAMVGRVISTGSNIAVGRFLMVQPTFVMGLEVEGGPGSFTPTGSTTVPVYLLGPGKPASGDYLVCRYADNRWVAEKSNPSGVGGGVGGGTIPNCFCTPIPATLTMASADESCNYRMFQSCTLQFGPTPPSLARLNLGTNIYLSTAGFPDPLANGATFYYFLNCQYSQFTLTRVYLESPYGSPFRDGILYSWLLGGYGNTCSPFHLDNGQALPGSATSCIVTIDGA